MADTIYNPKELGEVFDRALDRCFELIYAGENDSIAFLVMRLMDGTIIDQRIAIEAKDDYFEPQDHLLREYHGRIMIYAFAVVGDILLNGKQHHAVVIEAGECDNDEAMILAHRYKAGLLGIKKPRPVGGLELVGMRSSRI